MLLQAVADRLHDLPAVAAGHVDETLDPQHVVRAGSRPASRARNASPSSTGPAVDDKAVEIIVVVLAFELVHRGAGGEVVLGGGGEAQRHLPAAPCPRARRRA